MQDGHDGLVDVHLRELRAFAAVAEALHFTRAAERLHLSQPALSRQVRALERRLGVGLLERDRRQVRLTAAGEALLPHAQGMLRDWETARRELARAAEGTLTVGMQTSPGRGLLPEVRARLAAQCPAARLVLRQVGWDDPTAGLRDRSCDVAFLWLPLEADAGCDWITIARERRLVALPAGHRLAGAGEVTMADLLDEPFLALPAGSRAMRDFWLATDARGGRPVRVGAEVRNSEETFEAVATGLGVVLLAEGNAPLLDRGDVVMVPVADLPEAELVLAWRRAERSALGEHFARICADVAGERLSPRAAA